MKKSGVKKVKVHNLKVEVKKVKAHMFQVEVLTVKVHNNVFKGEV